MAYPDGGAWRSPGPLREDQLAVSEIAERVGYGSTSAFSVAFSRHVGQSPSRYARTAAHPSAPV
ncbi:MAG: AraC family transcriptional regulator [Vicinamibacterales bacterium]